MSSESPRGARSGTAALSRVRLSRARACACARTPRPCVSVCVSLRVYSSAENNNRRGTVRDIRDRRLGRGVGGRIVMDHGRNAAMLSSPSSATIAHERIPS